MDRTLKKYINDLMVTLVLSKSSSIDDINVKFSKVRLRMLNAIKNYCALRIKLLQNKNITDIEHELIRKVAKVAIDSACKSYNITLPDKIKDTLVDDYFEQLLDFIHNIRCDVFSDCLKYCELGAKMYENK